MRTKNSIKNSITSLITSIISIIIGFFAQTIFIKILGIEYLGLNGLFSNVLNMLNIFELGIGSSIIYNLYKPIKNNDVESIKGLINFYKKIYTIIAIVIFSLGLLICPFIKYFIKDVTVNVNIYLIYILSLLGTVSSYILTYKRSILNADQKNYVISIFHSIYLVILNISQLVILYFTKNFYLYLGLKIVFQLLQNIQINLYVDKNYPYLKGKNKNKIDYKLSQNIFSNAKALFLHKIGSAIVFGTDNIIISKYLGVSIVGYYSNYSLIINTISNLSSKFISSTTSSVGNLCVDGNEIQKYGVFTKIRFINFIISSFSATCLLCLMQPFIKIWIGKEFLLDFKVLIILIISYYLVSMRIVYGVYRDSNGIWSKDKFLPIFESIINIVVSVFLVKRIGLIGVFIGTIISGLIWWIYGFPKYVYKQIFKRSYLNYFIETLCYFVVFVVICIFCFLSILYISNTNIIVDFIIKLIVVFVVYVSLISIIFYQNKNFRYILNLLLKKDKNK